MATFPVGIGVTLSSNRRRDLVHRDGLAYTQTMLSTCRCLPNYLCEVRLRIFFMLERPFWQNLAGANSPPSQATGFRIYNQMNDFRKFVCLANPPRSEIAKKSGYSG